MCTWCVHVQSMRPSIVSVNRRVMRIEIARLPTTEFCAHAFMNALVLRALQKLCLPLREHKD